MANFIDNEDEVQAENVEATPAHQDFNETDTETDYYTAEEQDRDSEYSQVDEQEPTGKSYIDPNDVVVAISNKNTPIVVLFGPPACGKTMTLVRLSRYLKNVVSGYDVKPVRSFRPDDDGIYRKLCDEFSAQLNASAAAGGNDRMNFMLVSVSRGAGDQICQLLEAPGELYFDPNKSENDPNATVYLNKIINSPNKKIYVVMLEPNWRSEEKRRAYVDRIKYLKKKMRPKDRVILLGNKVDKADEYIKSAGNVNDSGYQKFISDQYPGLFELFKEQRPIINFFKPYDCEFVPFQTGTYCKGSSDKRIFEEGDDAYPKNLWAKISKCAGR